MLITYPVIDANIVIQNILINLTSVKIALLYVVDGKRT